MASVPPGKSTQGPSDLHHLAELIRIKNHADRDVAELIDRPAHSGHIGEYVAAHVFDIELHEGATHKASDGYFQSGSTAGRTVNVKYYFERQGIIDLAKSANAIDHADFYLVMTGPKTLAGSSRGKFTPLVITQVFLFEARQLLSILAESGRSSREATSFKEQYWTAAMIFPHSNSADLVLTETQKDNLRLFAESA